MSERIEAQKYVAQNRKARFEFAIGDKYEVGMVLTGTEVKSLRAGGVSIMEAYAGPAQGEIYLFNANFAEYKKAGSHLQHTAIRPRKLLMHKSQRNKLIGAVQRDGVSLVPLSIYFNAKGKAKLELGVAKGRKKEDKRAAIKDREGKREAARAMKNKGRE
ncbi:MAG: SsrA-binding protein SmpB [Alphaproteobacteria bacterium]|nr:SsrA-binding protein SmpB [Alphaproteobacteria bacterium]